MRCHGDHELNLNNFTLSTWPRARPRGYAPPCPVCLVRVRVRARVRVRVTPETFGG